MKTKLSYFLFLIILLAAVSCKDEPPVVPPTTPKPNATLSLKDKSCTELWLNLQLENFTLPVDVELIRDNLLQIEITGLYTNDTTIYIDSLLPNKTYNFIAVVKGNEQQDTSSQLQVTTLDTTSHFFLVTKLMNWVSRLQATAAYYTM